MGTNGKTIPVTAGGQHLDARYARCMTRAARPCLAST